MNDRIRKKKQLRKYNFHYNAIYNASTTMATFIYELLADYKRIERYSFDSSSPKEWELILDELIWTFKELKDNYSNSPYTIALETGYRDECVGSNPVGYVRNNDGTITFKPRHQEIVNKYITDEVIKEEKEYRNRIKYGLELFGRYYESIKA